MHIKNLTTDYSCSAQITLEDLEELHAQGVKSLICFRPDGEHVSQPMFDELTCKASELGIVCYYLPYEIEQVSPGLLASMYSAIEGAPKPAHAFCKTGRRAALPIAFSRMRGGENFETVIDEFKEIGFDVLVVKSHL